MIPLLPHPSLQKFINHQKNCSDSPRKGFFVSIVTLLTQKIMDLVKILKEPSHANRNSWMTFLFIRPLGMCSHVLVFFAFSLRFQMEISIMTCLTQNIEVIDVIRHSGAS
jgi:hypothetical protein